jgi:tetratricopeptide (TPR) repeat protein
LLLQAQGDYEAAQPLYQRALDIREQALGPKHPDTATSLNNLAGLLQAQGDYEAAQPLYQRALDILEARLGPDHPHTRIVRGNLASLPHK